MASPYQHLFDAAAQEAGNLYCLWRSLGLAEPVDAGGRLAVELRLKRQLALLAQAPAAAGLAAVQRAIEVGSDGDWLSAGWYCVATPAVMDRYAERAPTPLAKAALAAGIACAPAALARQWVSKWSPQPQYAQLLLGLRTALGDEAGQSQLAWRGPPVTPPVAAN